MNNSVSIFANIFGSEELEIQQENGDEVVIESLPTTGEEVIEMVAEAQSDEFVAEVKEMADEEVEPVVETVEDTAEAIEEGEEIVEVIDGNPIEGVEGLFEGDNYNPATAKYVMGRMTTISSKIGYQLSDVCSLTGNESFSDMYAVRHQIIAGKEGLMDTLKRVGTRVWDFIKRIMQSIWNFFVGIFSSKKKMENYANQTIARLNACDIRKSAQLGGWQHYITPESGTKTFGEWATWTVNTNQVLLDMYNNIVSTGSPKAKEVKRNFFVRMFQAIFKKSAVTGPTTIKRAGMLICAKPTISSKDGEVDRIKIEVNRDASFQVRSGEFQPRETVSSLRSGLNTVKSLLSSDVGKRIADACSGSNINKVVSRMSANDSLGDEVAKNARDCLITMASATTTVSKAGYSAMNAYMKYVNACIIPRGSYVQ